MRLALALGKLPSEIDAMPFADFVEMQEFYELEPWGLAVQDALSAHTISAMANLKRDPERRPEAYMIKDFLLFGRPDAPEEEPTVDGKTGAQWQLIFAAEALQAQQQPR